MKKTILKVSTAALLLTQIFSVVGASAQGLNPSAPRVAATGAPQATAPIVTDNLAKYGLKKDVELPVTVTAGGLSYTLHKVMILDFNSKEAVVLRKKYQYEDSSDMIAHPKYFVWTKITITNKSQNLVQRNYKDMLYKWRLFFDSGMNNGELDKVMPIANRFKPNSTEALNDFKLKPGQSLTTYQALYYEGEFKYFGILLEHIGAIKSQYVVNDPETKR
ncbi:hypothetical protein J2Z22_001544 [Paenibacillus forsythiae]|uniref:Uncharacterized protein n=1 Tax=Paenibacillus forsythiae TaxID=365616 RepID=A0ABU3H5C4_9BACL|nr:hypothetical protein [Paenibacillus forsythiae]MDT3426024.1 hypothetical protein [Paenibacillus forsythiae]